MGINHSDTELIHPQNRAGMEISGSSGLPAEIPPCLMENSIGVSTAMQSGEDYIIVPPPLNQSCTQHPLKARTSMQYDNPAASAH